jgi:hypothetical protein
MELLLNGGIYPATDLQYTADTNQNRTWDKSGLCPLQRNLSLPQISIPLHHAGSVGEVRDVVLSPSVKTKAWSLWQLDHHLSSDGVGQILQFTF